MPDAPILPAPDNGNPKKKRKVTRATLNQAQVRELSNAEQVVIAAQKVEFKPKLTARQVTAGFVDLLVEDIEEARETSANAMHSTTDKESATVSEAGAKDELVTAIREIQAAAKQKYRFADKVKLQDYLVGKVIDNSRADLEQYAAGIVTKLEDDSLPGITAAKVTALNTLLQAYKDTQSTQTTEQASATGQRLARNDRLQSITQRRATIQFAADAEWPWSDPTNTAVRKQFQLPLDRPFKA